MDLATAFNTSWPILLVCAVALALVWWLLRSSIASVQQALAQIADAHGKLNAKIVEIDRRIGQVGTQQLEFLGRLTACERSLQRERSKADSPSMQAPLTAQHNEGDAMAAETPEALNRFDEAAQTLARLARELDGLDTRQSEQLLRMQGDLDEQSFHLQRVQQHVDRLFAPAQAQATAAVATH